MKYIVATILAMISIQCFGQFSKRDKVLGGTFSLTRQRAPASTNGGLINKATSFEIVPSFGMFVNESIEIGLQAGYSSSEYERNTIYPTISNWGSRGATVGLYAQKYFHLTDKFLFSLIGTTHYDFGTSYFKTTNTITNEVTKTDDEDRRIGIYVTPNIIFFLSNNWALKATLGSIGYKHSNNGDQPLNLFSLEYGTINLGLGYYFRQKINE
jgi:hypothetical protein